MKTAFRPKTNCKEYTAKQGRLQQPDNCEKKILNETVRQFTEQSLSNTAIRTLKSSPSTVRIKLEMITKSTRWGTMPPKLSRRPALNGAHVLYKTLYRKVVCENHNL